MLFLVLGALWRRRAQAVLLFVLAVVATAGAAAAPVYIVGSVQSLAASSVVGASTSERVVSADAHTELSGDPATDLRTFRAQVGPDLSLPGFAETAAVGLDASFGERAGRIDYREDVCRHLTIEGACPSTANELVIPRSLAVALGVGPGGSVAPTVTSARIPRQLRVVGIYEPRDPREPYWGRTAKGKQAQPQRLADDDAFTVLATIAGLGKVDADLSVDFVATPQAFRQRDPQLHALAFERGQARLATHGVAVASDLRVLADRIYFDQQLIYVGVAVGAGELLLMCWFALFLAVSQTSSSRRSDVGLLKMRGQTRRDLWRLVAGQSLVPLVAGGLVGVAAGPAVAWWATGGLTGDIRQVIWGVAATTGLAVVGAVIAALVAERRMLTESVTTLSRGVVGHRRLRSWSARTLASWRSGVFDAFVVVVATAAVFQVKAGAGGGSSNRGIEVAAPILLILAVGVLAARMIPVVAAAVGRRALRAGRLGSGLAALHLARRPGAGRVLGLVVVVVAVLAGTADTWSASDRARHERAIFEVGADRVLTVVAPNSGRLLAAVRQVDPSGQYAMAAIERTSGVPVLAVDATRLATVVPWLPAYGLRPWSDVVASLRPAGTPETVPVDPAALALDATWTSAGNAPVSVVATLKAPDSPLTTVAFGPLRPGRNMYRATTAPACGAGCRLVAVGLSSIREQPTAGSIVTVHALGGLGDSGLLADRTRWRADVLAGAQVPRITAGPDGLTMTITAETLSGASALSAAAYVLDAPTPAPVVASGQLELAPNGDPRAPLVDATPAPVHVVAQARRLPRLGSGLLVDLEYAVRLSRSDGGGTMQVWLGANAPPDVQARLQAAGLTIVGEQSVPVRLDALADQGPPAATRFLLLVALLGVVLALISFAVMAAVERGPRAQELAALRRQGLRPGVIRQVTAGGYAALATAAVLVGLVAALILVEFFPPSLPVFGDGWTQLPAPGAEAYVLPAAAGTFAIVLGVLTTGAAVGLISAVRRRMGEAS
jgi:putative ABC transport system permease protein